MFSIVLQIIFKEYQNKNHIVKTSLVTPGLRPREAKKAGF